MAFRDLVDADCGGANALTRMGSHFAQDVARKEDGISRRFGAGPSFIRDQIHSETPGADQLVNEFLGAAGPMHPPQTFRMDALLQEMREIDAHRMHSQHGPPPVILTEIPSEAAWADEFYSNANSQMPTAMPGKIMPMQSPGPSMVGMMAPQQMSANDFFTAIPQVCV